MNNLTTPFKASAAAWIAHALVKHLGMADVEASYVADAAWLVLTAGITYAVPADFGSGIATRMLAWGLRMRFGLVLLAVAGLGSLTGCASQQSLTAAQIRQGCVAADLAVQSCFAEANRRAAAEAVAGPVAVP